MEAGQQGQDAHPSSRRHLRVIEGDTEDRLELARHHRDFALISELVEKALDHRLSVWVALSEIRKIVG